MKKTKKIVSQAMEAFIHDTNVIDTNGNERIYPTIWEQIPQQKEEW